MALEKQIRIKVDSSKAERNVNSLDRSVNNLDKSADKTNKSFGTLKTTVIAVAAALQAGVIVKYADAFTSAQNQIRQTVTTTQQLTQRTGELFAVAQRSRTEFGATAELYTQLTLSTENLNLSTDELVRLTETIGKSFSASGKSAAESAGAIRQLGQAFSSGALRGDEFNSIAEGAPEIMRALQRSLNLTQGELRDFATTGGITAEILVTALGGAADVIDEKLKNSSKTFAQFAQEAENNAVLFVGSSDAITGSVNLAGEAILGISQNLELLADVAVAGAIVGFGRLSSSIILSTVETVKNTVANTANLTSVKLLSNGIGGTTKRIVAMTAAQKAATVASTSLNRVVGLLGGPVGLAITAASAIAFFALTADDAADDARNLAERTDELAQSFDNLTKSQIEVKLANATVEANRLEKQIFLASEKLNKLENFSGDKMKAAVNAQKRVVAELNKELEQAILKRDALFQAGLSSGRTPEEGTGKRPGETEKASPKSDPFVNTERFRTESLKAELNERQAIQRAYNEFLVGEFQSVADQERAIAEFNRLADLAELETRKTNAQLDFQQRREQLLTNTRLDAEAKFELQAELEQQELTQNELFEMEKTRIAEDAAAERADIARNEFAQRINTFQLYANASLQLNELFGSKSEKANKKRRTREARVNGAAGIVRAWAEHEFYEALGMTILIAASTEAQIANMNSASGGGGRVSAPSQVQTSQRQEPIQQQSSLEFRGLTEVAEALRNLDPDEVLPVEYTQRIVASLSEYERFSGGG
jgi:tape measure domain-containing protein